MPDRLIHPAAPPAGRREGGTPLRHERAREVAQLLADLGWPAQRVLLHGVQERPAPGVELARHLRRAEGLFVGLQGRNVDVPRP